MALYPFRAALAATILFVAAGAAQAQSAPPQVGSGAPTLAAPELPAAEPASPLINHTMDRPAAAAGDSAAQAAATGQGESAAQGEAAELSAGTTMPEAATLADLMDDPAAALGDAHGRAMGFLADGGPTIWAISALSVVTVALILWKAWRFFLAGAWSRRASKRAVDLWERGQRNAALQLVSGRRGVRSRLTMAAMQARRDLSDTAAREETARVAKRLLAGQGGGLRALELIATVAPLLGLLGTVLGMIAAFQALQEAGNRADPAMLAGGIWEALLTTAAGMAVAIPASAALTWCEAVIDSIRTDMEDLAARIFVASEIAEVGAVQPPRDLAAE